MPDASSGFVCNINFPIFVVQLGLLSGQYEANKATDRCVKSNIY